MLSWLGDPSVRLLGLRKEISVDKKEVVDTLRLALRALNLAPCFRVPAADSLAGPGPGNSYKVCSEIERVLQKLEEPE